MVFVEIGLLDAGLLEVGLLKAGLLCVVLLPLPEEVELLLFDLDLLPKNLELQDGKDD